MEKLQISAETATYVVQEARAGQFEYAANGVTMPEGYLVLTLNGNVIACYAPGSWASFYLSTARSHVNVETAHRGLPGR